MKLLDQGLNIIIVYDNILISFRAPSDHWSTVLLLRVDGAQIGLIVHTLAPSEQHIKWFVLTNFLLDFWFLLSIHREYMLIFTLIMDTFVSLSCSNYYPNLD